MKSLMIINPESGQGRAARQKRMLLDIASETPHIHAMVTHGPGSAEKLACEAAQNGYDQVIVAGGDGTINQVINGISDSGLPMGIVPLGTGNVLAHDLGIPPHDALKAMEIIDAGNIRSVDVAQANGKRFLLMAGFGFDAEVIDLVSPEVKDVFGTMAYAPALIQQMAKVGPANYSLIFEDGSIYNTQAFSVIIANCGSYAYNFKIAPEAIFDDGLLDILIFEWDPTIKLKLIGKALESLIQQRIPDINTTYFRASKVRIESNPRVKMQLDGDVIGESGTEISILPKALKLIVPKVAQESTEKKNGTRWESTDTTSRAS